MNDLINKYYQNISKAFESQLITEATSVLSSAMINAWVKGKSIYFCGNGGSAGNANHLANDFLYGAGVHNGIGLRVESLSSNSSILTCLANDIGYDQVYAEQLRVKANKGDVLIALSGSGNSMNIVKALEMGNKIGMKTFAILGFSGGKCKETAQHAFHFEIHDMQVSEDLQMIIGHICMKYLSNKKLDS